MNYHFFYDLCSFFSSQFYRKIGNLGNNIFIRFVLIAWSKILFPQFGPAKLEFNKIEQLRRIFPKKSDIIVNTQPFRRKFVYPKA